jgi:uncharacterized membrane protein
METELWAIGLVVFACLIGSFGPIFLKKASNKISLSLKSIIYNRYLIAGLIFYGLSTLLFIPALKGGELSVLYPFVATVYIWVSLLSIKMLNEKMSKFKWLGILLIIIGVSFIGLGS